MDAFLFRLFLICKNLHPDSIRDSRDFETFNQKLRVCFIIQLCAMLKFEISFFLCKIRDLGWGGVTFLEARYSHLLIAEIDANSGASRKNNWLTRVHRLLNC